MLQGIRIVEFEGLGPGPFAAMHLAQLGAEVVVIHRKGGADNPSKAARNPLDRGKRSIALDLKDPDDLAVVMALAARADAIIEGFRPGVMERLGLGPEVLHEVNPGLVYGRMTGWGQHGPRAERAGHDLNYLSLSGALHYAGHPGDAPVSPATMLGDIGGGALYLTIGILSGILRARGGGGGCVVDAAIVDGSAHMMGLLMSLQAQNALSETRGQSLLDGPHWSRAYRCKDGKWLTVQALEAKFYSEFLDRMGVAEEEVFASQYDPKSWGPATARLTMLFALRDRDDWAEIFAESDACVAPVMSPWEAAEEPHMRAREVWRKAPEGLVPGAAPRFGDWHAGETELPERDGDRAEILKELGL